MEFNGRGGRHSRSSTFPPARSIAGSRYKDRSERTGSSFSDVADGGRLTHESWRNSERNRFAIARPSSSGASGSAILRGTWSWANPAPVDCSPWWIDGHGSSAWKKSTTKRRDTFMNSSGKRCRSFPPTNGTRPHSTTEPSSLAATWWRRLTARSDTPLIQAVRTNVVRTKTPTADFDNSSPKGATLSFTARN